MAEEPSSFLTPVGKLCTGDPVQLWLAHVAPLLVGFCPRLNSVAWTAALLRSDR